MTEQRPGRACPVGYRYGARALAAPASLKLEVTVGEGDRADPGWIARQHAAIAAAMGEDEAAETPAS